MRDHKEIVVEAIWGYWSFQRSSYSSMFDTNEQERFGKLHRSFVTSWMATYLEPLAEIKCSKKYEKLWNIDAQWCANCPENSLALIAPNTFSKGFCIIYMWYLVPRLVQPEMGNRFWVCPKVTFRLQLQRWSLKKVSQSAANLKTDNHFSNVSLSTLTTTVWLLQWRFPISRFWCLLDARVGQNDPNARVQHWATDHLFDEMMWRSFEASTGFWHNV